MRFWLFALFLLARGDDMARRYFSLLDLDDSGYVDKAELVHFVTSMLTMSGMPDMSLEMEANGRSLRELIEDTFLSTDRDADGKVTSEEAISAQDRIQFMMGSFMAHNLPKSEF
ncbi:hypothetical protein CTAYLR_005934 [Chrysophaeum taylorii]|uniref:EF-hand domain-containing protein n=1 Tax=Chrysophaeum taylorii TaxID=2483200 RepID=A0AAD7UBK8_9STRA|nr:hypothetical protein CTAYLR_005934 [Chrysophaeum taylorii]